jgi:hypothetical protein
MANRGRPSVTKRQKEAARREKQQRKAVRKAERDASKGDRDTIPEGEDPDIAGIVPGPSRFPTNSDAGRGCDSRSRGSRGRDGRPSIPR